jgi:hypothetical protein
MGFIIKIGDWGFGCKYSRPKICYKNVLGDEGIFLSLPKKYMPQYDLFFALHRIFDYVNYDDKEPSHSKDSSSDDSDDSSSNDSDEEYDVYGDRLADTYGDSYKAQRQGKMNLKRELFEDIGLGSDKLSDYSYGYSYTVNKFLHERPNLDRVKNLKDAYHVLRYGDKYIPHFITRPASDEIIEIGRLD